jgi:geranylgeranyl pyrophosphate synthase
MDIYQSTIDYLSNMPLVHLWPEIQTLFARAATRRPRHWRLPILACEAVGGSVEQVVPAIAAIGCLHISILLVDDMLDADIRGEHHRLGEPVTANLAIAFQAAGLSAIAQSEFAPLCKLAMLVSLNKMMLTTALGQYLDVQNTHNEETYWRLVRLKSAPFFGAALHIGALLGGKMEDATAEQIQQIGQLYGEMIQVHDDLNDSLMVPANSDWTLGRMPLPILFASQVNHPDRDRFVQLRNSITDPEALAEAQTILIRSGAVSYCLDQLLHKSQAARDILANISLIHHEQLNSLLDEIVSPVQRLLSVAGLDGQEFLTR